MQKVKPILFNTAMVRAILDGRKTQTRRLVSPQPQWEEDSGIRCAGWAWRSTKFALSSWPEINAFSNQLKAHATYQPGDILWVRETFACVRAKAEGESKTIYRADGEIDWCDDDGFMSEKSHWRPSIHMPKGACRTWLKVTGARVERLQDISEKDAADEGVEREFDGEAWRFFAPDHSEHGDPRCAFMRLWDSLAKPGFKFADNPWVWAYEFEICDKPEVVNA